MKLRQNRPTGEAGLKKELGYHSLTSIVVANMIGAGIFTTSGLLIARLYDPVLMMVLWMAGGILALCGALSYAELGSNYPEAGGEYIFLSRLFSPLPGFLSGWVSFVVGFSAPIAASSLAFSEYMVRALPPEGLAADPLLLKRGMAVGIIVLFTLVHSLGLRSGSRFQNILTMMKILLIAGFLFAGFIYGEGDLQHFTERITGSPPHTGFRSAGWALILIMFSYSGWNASTYVGSEIRHPGRNIPRSLIIGTLVVTFIYLALNVLFIYAIPADDMSNVISIGGLAANKLFGISADRFFSVFIALILLSSISAYIIIGPRVYFAMSEAGHFFKAARHVNRYHVPGVSILAQSLLAVIFVITGTFDQILTLLGFSLGVFPVLCVIGVFKLRTRGASVLKMPGYPFVQILFIAASVSILVLTFLERPAESGIALGVIAAGVPIYYLLKRIRPDRKPE
ncbi:MAG TPA: amino acid permease [Bacteroides sp.]|nr:amino acid permease [Bacteroides sp.]